MQIYHLEGLALVFLVLFMLELPIAFESLRVSRELFLLSSPSRSSTSYLFFFVIGPSLVSSGITSPPVFFHSLYALTDSMIKQITSRSRITPKPNKSRQQVEIHSDPEAYKLYKKQKITSPDRQNTLPAISYLKLFLNTKNPALRTMIKAMQQLQTDVWQRDPNTVSTAKRIAFKQFVNQSHFTIGSSPSWSKNLYKISWIIGYATNTAKTTIAGIERLPPLNKASIAKQPNGKQNHLISPLRNLQTLRKVKPFSVTFSGIVINLIKIRKPTSIARNEIPKAVTPTQVPLGVQNVLIASSLRAIMLLATSSSIEKGNETDVARANMQAHCKQSKALECTFLTKASKSARVIPMAEKTIPMMFSTLAERVSDILYSYERQCLFHQVQFRSLLTNYNDKICIVLRASNSHICDFYQADFQQI